MIPGIHVSTAGGLCNAPLKLKNLDLPSGQIFTANQRRWINKEIPVDTASRFTEVSEGLTLISHASYLINLASANPEVREKSHIALLDEFKRCQCKLQLFYLGFQILGIKYLVMHPGAHQKQGREKGIEMISSSLSELLSSVNEPPILLLENTAGAGTTIGWQLEELAAIRDNSTIRELIGYCIDTAHACGAGYSIDDSPGVLSLVSKIDQILGADNVKAFHMNDSKVECDSRRDRHEHFGEGTIGLDALRLLFQSPLFSEVLGIAETPGTDDDRADDIRKLSLSI